MITKSNKYHHRSPQYWRETDSIPTDSLNSQSRQAILGLPSLSWGSMAPNRGATSKSTAWLHVHAPECCICGLCSWTYQYPATNTAPQEYLTKLRHPRSHNFRTRIYALPLIYTYFSCSMLLHSDCPLTWPLLLWPFPSFGGLVLACSPDGCSYKSPHMPPWHLQENHVGKSEQERRAAVREPGDQVETKSWNLVTSLLSLMYVIHFTFTK